MIKAMLVLAGAPFAFSAYAALRRYRHLLVEDFFLHAPAGITRWTQQPGKLWGRRSFVQVIGLIQGLSAAYFGLTFFILEWWLAALCVLWGLLAGGFLSHVIHLAVLEGIGPERWGQGSLHLGLATLYLPIAFILLGLGAVL